MIPELERLHSELRALWLERDSLNLQLEEALAREQALIEEVQHHTCLPNAAPVPTQHSLRASLDGGGTAQPLCLETAPAPPKK